MPPQGVAAGPTSPSKFRRSSWPRLVFGNSSAATCCRGGRPCRLWTWRQVPRVGSCACRHAPAGLFCSFFSKMVFLVNSTRQVVLLNKKSYTTALSLTPTLILVVVHRIKMLNDTYYHVMYSLRFKIGDSSLY